MIGLSPTPSGFPLASARCARRGTGQTMTRCASRAAVVRPVSGRQRGKAPFAKTRFYLAMQRIVYFVAVIAVLFHVWGGCCWHHPLEAGPLLQLNDCSSKEGFTCCGDHGAERSTEPEDGHGTTCSFVRCAFTLPGSSRADAKAFPSKLTGPLPPADPLPAGLVSTVRQSRPPPAGPMRLHLLKQVLLV